MRLSVFRPAKLSVLLLVMLFAIGVFVLRAPIRSAKKIQKGDPPSVVHDLLGEPEAVFTSTAELRDSYLEPMSYVFWGVGNDDAELKVDELPDVAIRAEWFEFFGGSAGHLVYYDEDGVTAVYWGGT